MTGKRFKFTVEEWNPNVSGENQPVGVWDEIASGTVIGEKKLATLMRAYSDDIDPQDNSVSEGDLKLMKELGLDLSAFMGQGKKKF